jgi:hypothetical protein
MRGVTPRLQARWTPSTTRSAAPALRTTCALTATGRRRRAPQAHRPGNASCPGPAGLAGVPDTEPVHRPRSHGAQDPAPDGSKAGRRHTPRVLARARCLARSNWREWPTPQADAIRELIEALWEDLVTTPEPLHDVALAFATFAAVTGDLAAALASWPDDDTANRHVNHELADLMTLLSLPDAERTNRLYGAALPDRSA